MITALEEDAGARLTLGLTEGLPSLFTFTRASAGWRIDAAGNLAEMATNVPRFDYDLATGKPCGLLREPQSTNQLINPRAEGATVGAIGSGGALPTTATPGSAWVWSNNGPAGITREIVAVTSVRGVPVLRVRISGTPGSTAPVSVSPSPLNQVAAATGQTWTFSGFIALQAGSLSNVTINTRVISRTAGGGAAGGVPVQTGPAITPTAALQRFSQVSTLTGDATTAAVQGDVIFTLTSGLAVDFTLDIGAPQMEQLGYASSPILPAVGTPAATTRAQDVPTLALSAIPWLIGPAGYTAAIDFDLLSNAQSGGQLLAVSDGTANNIAHLSVNASAQMLATSVVATVSVASGTTALATAGTPSKAALQANATGVTASLNGGAVITAANAGYPAMTTLALMPSAAGHVSRLRLFNRAIPPAALPQVTA